MTIKEFVKNAINKEGQAYKEVLNGNVSFEITFGVSECIKYVIFVSDLHLEETSKSYGVLNDFFAHTIIEKESLYGPNHLNRNDDISMKQFCEKSLVEGDGIYLSNFSLATRQPKLHKFISKVEDNKLQINLIVDLSPTFKPVKAVLVGND